MHKESPKRIIFPNEDNRLIKNQYELKQAHIATKKKKKIKLKYNFLGATVPQLKATTWLYWQCKKKCVIFTKNN